MNGNLFARAAEGAGKSGGSKVQWEDKINPDTGLSAFLKLFFYSSIG